MIHNFDPIILHIGPLLIRWYSLAYILGIALGIFYIKYLTKKTRLKLPLEFWDSLFCAGVIGIVVGGRLGHVLIYNPIEYFKHPIEIFKTWKGGMSFHGGAIGAITAIIFVSKKYSIDYWKLLDLASCAAPIGIFFGRIANFINGYLFGKPTELPWGVIFLNTGGGPFLRHPTQIYEALTEGLLLFIILNIIIIKYKAYKKTRIVSALFCILYSLFRFCIEFLKEPDQHIGYIFSYFTMGQLLSLIMIAVGIIILWSSSLKNKTF
ncbi:MAG: prolipoprotein diacylglyceryl transferase [Rickettsiales bacterium]|nr:prolipoprotein diacylglyceryl transferase [Rickettsiales bacterium]